MPNTYVNKVQKADGTTILDISDTTAVASDVATGKYFYLATGQKVQGSSTSGGYVTQDANGYVVLSPTSGLPTLITKSITQNGTYNASSDNATGYSSVSVNVQGSGNFEVKTTSVTSQTSISFPVSGEPRAFTLVPAGSIGVNNSYIASILYDGSSLYVYMITSGSPMVYTGAEVRFSYSQSTLTISTGQFGPYFQNYLTYRLLNVY